MADMIPVLEVALMVPSYPQESQTSKWTEASSCEKFFSNTALRPSLPADLLLIWGFSNFMILSENILV